MNEITKKIEALPPEHQQKVEQYVEKLEKEILLSKELQAKLDKLGNTPIAEPTAYEALKKDKAGNLNITKASKALFTDEELLKYDAVEASHYLYLADKKINDFFNEDRTFKTTPKTENARPPRLTDVEDLMETYQAVDKAKDKFFKAIKSGEEDKIKKAKDKLEEASKKMEARAFEVAGLNKEDLTSWEKELIITTVYGTAFDAKRSSLGKPSAF